MIFNIAKKIDIELLNNKIEEFISNKIRQHPLHDCEPYIFMSPDTIEDMPKFENNQVHNGCFHDSWNANRMVGYYNGCKVFIDPTKKYGEVELR